MNEQPTGRAPSARTVDEYVADIRARKPELEDNDPVVRRLAFMYRVLAEAEAAYDGPDAPAKVIIDYQKLSNDALRLERALGLLAATRGGGSRPSGIPSARRGAGPAAEREYN
jgi:hypothetical protein